MKEFVKVAAVGDLSDGEIMLRGGPRMSGSCCRTWRGRSTR